MRRPGPALFAEVDLLEVNLKSAFFTAAGKNIHACRYRIYRVV
jgi:hypothetical protein